MGPRDGRELKVKLFELRLKCIEMKIGPALMAAIGIHSDRLSTGFEQMSESIQTMMLLPR